MVKRLSEARRNRELQRLIDDQSDDMSSSILFPETITRLVPKILEGLTIEEKSSILLSVIGKMSNNEIGVAMQRNESTIRGFIKRGYMKLKRKYK